MTLSLRSQKLIYKALRSPEISQLVQFSTALFTEETEINGNVLIHLFVSMTPELVGLTPLDLYIFVTPCRVSARGTKLFHTGTTGDLLLVIIGKTYAVDIEG
jgi:hypothetical protein